MLSLTRARSGALKQLRSFHASAASAAADNKKPASLVDPNDPQISPDTRPWADFKNEFYKKRGFTVAPDNWKGWDDLPAPYKYLGVKVDPAHVENHGPIWSMMSDWRQGVPAAILLSLPLWMFHVLPPFDMRLELSLITIAAGWTGLKAAGPMFRQWKRARVGTKVKALLSLEEDLNKEIDTSIEAFKAGSGVVEYMKVMNDAERALRKMEAEAATKRIQSTLTSSLKEQLEYLTSIAASGAADSEAEILRSAKNNFDASLSKDATVQQKTIDNAIKALKDGSMASADDLAPGLWAKALEKARADYAAKPAAASNPLANPQIVEIFKKRFGYTEDAVSEATLSRASDAASKAILTGKIGGKAPAVGAQYVLQAPILYARK